MELRILGPLEATDGDAPLALGPRRQRALLARLLLDANRTVAVERLVDDLWGAELPESAVKMVQIYVSGLRKVLPGEVLRTRAPGYAVEIGPEALDLHRFERLRAEGRAALAAGDPAAASERFREALSLWRGPALAEFSEPFAQRESGRLEELRVACLEERIDADLALGRHADLVGELEALSANEPLREGLRAQLMLALYRAGRQAEALAAYQSFRRRLDEELGIEPSGRLRELERAILLQDPALDPPAGRAEARAAPAAPAAAPPDLVGRDRELGVLRRALEGAMAGRRRLVLVTGEAGAGKSALVDAFLAATAAAHRVWIGRGQCTERHGPAEPYAPVLDGLSRLAQGPDGEEAIEILTARAPTWLAQMPWLIDPAELQALDQRARGATRERMLREIFEAIEAGAARRPVIVVLEDVHWADNATLELVVALVRHHEPGRVLVIGTSEPPARGGPEALRALATDLAMRGVGEELALGGLDVEAVRVHLERRFPAGAPPVAEVLHARTGGNPLFMRHLVDHWIAEGALAEEGGGARLLADPGALDTGVPGGLRASLDAELAGLADDEAEVLRAASVAGQEFEVAVVAGALRRPPAAVEELLAAVARARHLVEPAGAADWGNRAPSTRYRFVHALHRDVLYEQLPAERRVELHREIGASLEAAYGARAHDIAGELAGHYVAARDPDGAVRFLRLSAEQAFERRAHAEGIEHLRAALRAAGALPDGPSRTRVEIELESLLGQALVATDGWSAPESEASLLRARELAERLGDNEPLVSVLLVLATLYELRGEYARARALVEESVRLSPEHGVGRRLESHELLACSLFHQGAFERALQHADLGVALFERDGEPGHYDTFPATLGDNAGVACHDWAALALWFLGRPDEALERARRALELAGDPSRAYGLATAHAQMTIIHERRREPEAVLESAEATIACGDQWGYSYRVAQGRVLRGWALAALGQVEEGIEELVCGLDASRATGARMEDPYYLGLLADAYLRAGETEPGLSAVAEALEGARRERSQFHEAELHRLRAALLLAADGADRAAEASLGEALAIARRQGSPALELRAALSLGGLVRERGGSAEARSLVAAALDRFTEGFDTPDLEEAAAFLARPGRAPAPPAPAPVRSGRDAPIRYAKSGDLNIAYQVTGDGPVDLVLVPGFVSHLERDWEEPRHARFLERLGGLARLIRFDKRGTGLSDRPPDLPDLEARMDDVRAVMDASGSHRAVLLGYSEGGPMSVLFASTYPQRTRALVLFGAFAARVRSDDYPWAPTEAEREASARRVERDWGLEEVMHNMCPSADDAMARWWGERGRAAASPGAARALVQMNTRIDVRAVLPAVQVPTLVLHRRGDREVTVEEGRYLADTISGARFVELAGIDHFVAIDPDQIVDEIEPFVAGLGEPAAEAPALASVVAAEAERAPDVPAELFGDMRWTRDAILGDVARRYTGELLRRSGHGALLVFDGPARAIRAGLELVARFADVGLSGRVAVHSGPVDRDGTGDDGDAAAVAERLLVVAAPEEVLVTGTTRSLVEGSDLRFAEREAPGVDISELYAVRPPAPDRAPPIGAV